MNIILPLILSSSWSDCSLPNSRFVHKGMIHNVPISETDEDLLEILSPKGVSYLER